MFVTPSEIFELALSRHRQPWNWTLHFTVLPLLCLTLFFHSYLLLAAALIALGTGFFRLGLDDPPDNRWFRFVHTSVEWEKNWMVSEWTWRKIGRLGFIILSAVVTTWALWTRDPAALLLIMGFAYLARVVAENKAGGIEP